ncbi:hypothetical protein BGZ79_007832 [Entomortierella chlamydospora]|nr:hypothetical protein BGZ79_007832 [Entomortierella chlamydospora]
MTATQRLQDVLSRPEEHQTPSIETSTDSSQTGNMPTNPANQSQSGLLANDESDPQDGGGSQVGSNGTQDGSERGASAVVVQSE